MVGILESQYVTFPRSDTLSRNGGTDIQLKEPNRLAYLALGKRLHINNKRPFKSATSTLAR